MVVSMSEGVQDYIDLETTSPCMLVVAPVNESRRNELPDNYHDFIALGQTLL